LFTLFSSLHSSEKYSIKNKRKKDKRKGNQLSGLQMIKENVTQNQKVQGLRLVKKCS
jgi:hypothetical protein